MIHACCYLHVVNGKRGWLSPYVLALLYLLFHIGLLLVLLLCMRREMEEKVGGRTRCRGGVRAAAVGKGVRARVRCGGDGGGVGACAVVGHRAKRARERGRWGTGG
jgi:hypothetical protein